jgi:hypothetical protein
MMGAMGQGVRDVIGEVDVSLGNTDDGKSGTHYSCKGHIDTNLFIGAIHRVEPGLDIDPSEVKHEISKGDLITRYCVKIEEVVTE